MKLKKVGLYRLNPKWYVDKIMRDTFTPPSL